jgi:hypothetical protein
MPDTREVRAVAQFACPTCLARPGQPCTGKDGVPMRPQHGPACHPLRRALLGTINRVGGEKNETS